ncbi:hypothetical protein JCM9803A_02480 [Rhodococcus erythropolis]
MQMTSITVAESRTPGRRSINAKRVFRLTRDDPGACGTDNEMAFPIPRGSTIGCGSGQVREPGPR